MGDALVLLLNSARSDTMPAHDVRCVDLTVALRRTEP